MRELTQHPHQDTVTLARFNIINIKKDFYPALLLWMQEKTKTSFWWERKSVRCHWGQHWQQIK